MSSTLSPKTTWYKVSILVLYLGLACYAAGMVSPYWTYGSKTTDSRQTYLTYRGLWHVCRGLAGSVTCASRLSNPPEWLKAVLALQFLSLFGLAFAAGFVVLLACLQSFSRIPEVVACVASVLGFLGMLVFVGKTSTVASTMFFHFSWSFALDLVGSVIAFVASIIMAVNNKNGSSVDESAGRNAPDKTLALSMNSEYTTHGVV